MVVAEVRVWIDVSVVVMKPRCADRLGVDIQSWQTGLRWTYFFQVSKSCKRCRIPNRNITRSMSIGLTIVKWGGLGTFFTAQNKLFQDYWRSCFEINFSDRQEGLTVSPIICDR